MSGYLYKIDYNEEVRSAVYDAWIYDDDTPEVREQKRKAFDQLEFPILSTLHVSASVSAIQPKEPSILFRTKTDQELMQDLAQQTLDETIYLIEMEHEDFKVKTPLHATRPLRAKIGLKEGLRTDHRFFAYEHVFNERTNEVETRRRGVIRATSKIVDNRQEATGDMEPSRFYQVAGRRLQPGYLLQQRNDHGLEVLVGAELGIVSGAYARADYRLGRFVGIRALFVYVDGGIDAQEYQLRGTDPDEIFAFIRYSAGFAKGFQPLRNVEIRPYLGFGREHATIDDKDTHTLFFRTGVNVGINITHNVHLVGGIGTYSPFGNAVNEDDVELEPWNVLFEDRGGASQTIGLRVQF